MSDKLKAAFILDALKGRHTKEIWCEELALSSGARRCDFWVLHPHASKGYRATAYEIKVSRADFKRDTRAKQRDARLFSDEFYYVTPPGLIKLEEVPDWAGLLEISEDGRWKYISPAPRRDKDAPSWELVVSIMRNSGEVRRDTDLLRQRIAALEAENMRWKERDKQRWHEQAKAIRGEP
tara:strand:- start:4 stop:543 length:540 start_codon:yes stop_codon:yes gene_type:complete